MIRVKTALLTCSLISFGFAAFAQAPNTEHLKFYKFDVRILNFIQEPVDFPPPARLKPDTLFIGENPCDGPGWYISGTTLKIVPRVTGDTFTLSYAFKVHIFEEFTDVDNSSEHITNYIRIPPLSKNQFKIPAFKDNGYTALIKKKYNFRDTSVTVQSDERGPSHFRFTRNGKIFGDRYDALYLNIKRFNAGKFIESKYIVVYLTEGCD